MNNSPKVTLYGAQRCHKTRHYQDYLTQKSVPFIFKDVEENEAAAEELRSLYTTGKLNFPTLMVDGKKLRNPRSEDLDKWLLKKGLIV